MTELKTNQTRLEAKVDANHAEMIERFVNLRVDILVIHSKTQRLTKQQKAIQRFARVAVADVQAQQEEIETDSTEIKNKIAMAS